MAKAGLPLEVAEMSLAAALFFVESVEAACVRGGVSEGEEVGAERRMHEELLQDGVHIAGGTLVDEPCGRWGRLTELQVCAADAGIAEMERMECGLDRSDKPGEDEGVGGAADAEEGEERGEYAAGARVETERRKECE